LAPHDWRHVPDPALEKHFDALSTLSAEAFACYLPAYLLYALDHFTPDSLVTEFTIYLLATEDQDERMREYCHEHFGCLDARQMEWLGEFIQIVGADEDFRQHLGDPGAGYAFVKAAWKQP